MLSDEQIEMNHLVLKEEIDSRQTKRERENEEDQPAMPRSGLAMCSIEAIVR